MQAVIICGGKGTRLKSAIGNAPKALVKFNKKENLKRQIEILKKNGVKNFVFLVNNFESEISKFLKKSFNDKFIIHKDKDYYGTGGCLYSAKKYLKNNFLIIYSDIYFNFNFNRFIKNSIKKKSIVSCVVHANDHPKDSDTVDLDNKFYIKKINVKNSGKDKINNAISGVYFANKKFLSKFKFKKNKSYDLVNDIFIKLLNKKCSIFAYKSIEYIKDFGTPGRIKTVKKDIRINKIKNLNYSFKTKAVFIDRDGVINHENSKPKTLKNFKIFPKALHAIKKLNDYKIPCFIVSNQSGLAKGQFDLSEFFKIIFKLDSKLSAIGAYVDDFLICPHFTKLKYKNFNESFFSNYRKPNPGMIKTLSKRYGINTKQSFMIGDSDRDILAGKKAGLKTILVASPKINDYKLNVIPDYRKKNLNEAINLIIRTK
jgi:mannose-1-phosphate guanylyltransferase / phosphomannomutase